MFNPRVMRNTSLTLVACMLMLLAPMQSVHAGLVPTHVVAGDAQVQHERERIRDFLQREDVRDILVRQGLDPEMAWQRVQGMTDQEVAKLSQQIDNLPAGAGILGILFAVFVILLVTDILGFTKVFPFTRPVQ